MTQPTRFGDQLKLVRMSRNLMKSELADITNISASLLTRYEKNATEPNLKNFVVLCDAFGVSADFMLGRSITVIPSNASKITQEIERLSEEKKMFLVRMIYALKGLV